MASMASCTGLMETCKGSTFDVLAERVHPGARVLRHAGSGFTLTVQHGSLDCPIGPIYVEDSVKIVKSETDRMHYLISTVVCCEPSGREFPSSKPLLMDFPIGDGYDTTEGSDTFKVLCYDKEDDEWNEVDYSGVFLDENGKRFLRARVTGFTEFGLGEVTDIDRLVIPRSGLTNHICVANATGHILQLVLLPTSYKPRGWTGDYWATAAAGAQGFKVGGPVDGYRIEGTFNETHSTPADIRLLPEAKQYFAICSRSIQARALVATVKEIPNPRTIEVKYYSNIVLSAGGTFTLTDDFLAFGHHGSGTATDAGPIVDTVKQLVFGQL